MTTRYSLRPRSEMWIIIVNGRDLTHARVISVFHELYKAWISRGKWARGCVGILATQKYPHAESN